MWAEACALLDEAERRHRHFFELLAGPSRCPVWEPPADIFSDGVELEVVLALPGAHADDIFVQITSLGLHIETTVPAPAVRTRMNLVRMEIPYGLMRRRIDLPTGSYILSERRLDHGYLYLRLTREAA